MTVDSVSFRKALGCFASGVTVVTAVDEAGEPAGLTVSAFSSVSLAPPLVLICLDKRVSSLATFRKGPFAVNVLSEAQRAVSNRFSEKRDDRFEGIAFTPGGNGAPVLAGSLVAVECNTHAVVDAGDHEIIIGAVTRVIFEEQAKPLIYFCGSYAGLA